MLERPLSSADFPCAITVFALRTAHTKARLAGRDTFQHDEFAKADGNSPGSTEWSSVCTRARAGGKRAAQAHARTAAVLRAYVGRRMRPDDVARLERSSCVQNVQRVNQSGLHRAHRGVLPIAIRTRRSQVDGAAVDGAGKKRITPRPCRFTRKTGV